MVNRLMTHKVNQILLYAIAPTLPPPPPPLQLPSFKSPFDASDDSDVVGELYARHSFSDVDDACLHRNPVCVAGLTFYPWLKKQSRHCVS